MIVYAKTGQNNGELATISVDGKVRQSLKMPEGDVREPAWAPFTK
jgi:TolB protein